MSEDTAEQICSIFPGLSKDQLPNGEGWAVEKLQIATHNGTHLDAPYHYHSTMNNGERAITIDEVPLEWCFNPGVKLDFRKFEDGYIVTASDVEKELERIGHKLKPLDIVVVNTKAGKHYGKPDFLLKGCGMDGREATLYLTERASVTVLMPELDAPFPLTAQKFLVEKDPSIIWEGHRAGMEIGYCHLEKLTNLEDLPANGFEISCFPFKIKNASAGFTRAVAIFEE